METLIYEIVKQLQVGRIKLVFQFPLLHPRFLNIILINGFVKIIIKIKVLILLKHLG